VINRKPEAKRDLVEHFVYIGLDNIDAARRYRVAVEDALLKLEAMPGMGRRRESLHPQLRGLRSWVVKGFENYIIFYREVEGGIEVLRVLHGARDIDRALAEGL
jgi:toxin ParE1/3/4